MRSALLLVDIQRDFLPGGALAVPKGDQIIPVVDRLLQMPFDLIVATKDWHPREHGSFAPNHDRKVGDIIELEGIEQILWPIHCVQDTRGAEFGEGWDTSRVDKVFYKGTDPKIDSYSTFFDNARRRSTGLEDYLRSQKIEHVFVAGLATDYCVKYSAMDAVDLGFDTYLIEDACRGIELHPGDVEHTLGMTKSLGGHICHSEEVPGLLKDASG